ncbi:hypothetical protein B14911_09122 [Bacillus sp. NRRL B-14911]|nr:hypothetical protein B14911_09122 [Bacillus sp. NRRL B-14911]
MGQPVSLSAGLQDYDNKRDRPQFEPSPFLNDICNHL